MSLKIIYEQKQQNFSLGEGIRLSPIPHLHREIELICMLEGEASAYADSACSLIRKGDLFIAFPNQIHFYETHVPGKHYCIIFRPDMIPEMAEIFSEGVPQSAVLSGVLLDPRILALVDGLHEAAFREPYDQLENLRRGYLLALFAELVPKMHISRLPVGDSEALRTIVSFCTKNFSENLSLSVLEEQLHLNKYYISHLFSGKLGLKFNDYINSLRVSEACKYLLNSDMNVTEIGSLVGFNTPRTFNRAFVKQLGVSPTEYRRNRSARHKKG